MIPVNYDILNILIDYLNEVFDTNKWFIAGGALSGEKAHNINIFFYSKEDFLLANYNFNKRHPNSFDLNANITYEVYPRRIDSLKSIATIKDLPYLFIQLNKIKFGKPKKVISTFDINKSQIALKSNKELIKSSNYEQPIHLIHENLVSTSFKRYEEYITNKEHKGSYLQALKDYLNYVIKHPDVSITTAFEDTKSITSSELLLNSLEPINPIKLRDYSSDRIMENKEQYNKIKKRFYLAHYPELLL